jgi:hypothetical protein
MNEQQLAAVKLALEALLINCGGNTEGIGKEAITALQSIIEQPAPVQEPIGSLHVDTLALIPTLRHPDGGAKLWPAHKAKYDNSYVLVYTTPPAAQQKPWVWLSSEDEQEIKDNCTTAACVLKAVKAKIKEKNT